jgi:excisionase family DNA binding protein
MRDHLSAREAADYCGVSEKTVRNWLRAGRLKAEKLGRAFRIPREQLEPYREHYAESARTAKAPAPLSFSAHTAIRADSPYDGAGLPVSELLAMLRQAQREAVAKAEEAAMWRERAESLLARLATVELGRSSEQVASVPAANGHEGRGGRTGTLRRPRGKRRL